MEPADRDHGRPPVMVSAAVLADQIMIIAVMTTERAQHRNAAVEEPPASLRYR